VDFVALTYAKDVIVSLMGVPLGPASSGPIIGRTVQEWYYGFVDPVMAALTPPPPPGTPWWSKDAPLGTLTGRSADIPRWRELAKQLANGTAPAAAAKRFFSITLQMNDGLGQVGDVLEDMHQSSVRALTANVSITGRLPGEWGWGDLSNAPFALAGVDHLNWYAPASFAGGDPENLPWTGRTFTISWDGAPPSVYVTGVAARRYEMGEEDMRACYTVPPSASTMEHVNAARSCVYGDMVDGVWNLTHSTGAPVMISRGHYYGADPRMRASLGPGAAALSPSRERHNVVVVVDIVAGLPVFIQFTSQVNVGMKASPVLFPNMYNAQPGPSGYIWLPTSWSLALTYVRAPRGVGAALTRPPSPPRRQSALVRPLAAPLTAAHPPAAAPRLLAADDDAERAAIYRGHNELGRRRRRRRRFLRAVCREEKRGDGAGQGGQPAAQQHRGAARRGCTAAPIRRVIRVTERCVLVVDCAPRCT